MQVNNAPVHIHSFPLWKQFRIVLIKWEGSLIKYTVSLALLYTFTVLYVKLLALPCKVNNLLLSLAPSHVTAITRIPRQVKRDKTLRKSGKRSAPFVLVG